MNKGKQSGVLQAINASAFCVRDVGIMGRNKIERRGSTTRVKIEKSAKNIMNVSVDNKDVNYDNEISKKIL